MITVALTATIDAAGERVWRALLDPAERLIWDDRILGEIIPPRSVGRNRPESRRARTRPHTEDFRRICWRFRLAGVPLVLIDEIHRIEGHERMLGRISIGSMHFDQTITVHPEHDENGCAK